MKSKDFVNKGDFLTLILTDDFFKNNDKMLIDECAGFMAASTQT